jgi:hypothetical protein
MIEAVETATGFILFAVLAVALYYQWRRGKSLQAQLAAAEVALAPEFIVAPMPAEAVKGFAEPIVTYAVRGVQPILSRLTRAEERDNVKHN